MSQETPRHALTKKRVVCQIPAVDEIVMRLDVEYRVTDSSALTMDVYSPPEAKSRVQLPAVIFVNGYPDLGMQRILGCRMKEMGSYISWGQLTAASGMVAITYSTSNDPATDIQVLLQYVREHAGELGIDENRIGLWAASGNVPNALSVLMQQGQDYLKCAVLCYGLMLDLDGYTSVADGARQWGFANPCSGKSVANLPQRIPLFIVRAGQDEMPHLNETMDRFLSHAVHCNLPITFVNHPTAPHAFDLIDDSEMTREIIRQIVAFMRFSLLS